MNLKARLAKPSYVLRPDQVVRRAQHALSSEDRPTVTLPWGMPLQVNVREAIGAGIARTGVHELPVTETAWRLTEPTDLALDVGANVGYFTAVFAARAGQVISFEPHPVVGVQLATNVSRWRNRDRVRVLHAAASDRSGSAMLAAPEDHAVNEGRSSIATVERGAAVGEVETVTLDEVIGDRDVGVMKIDVEGHELAALNGAASALEQGRIRDVLFEEHDPLPTPVSRLLMERGFTVLALQERFRGVDLGGNATPLWHAPTYLATLDAGRAQRLMAPRGWRCLRPR